MPNRRWLIAVLLALLATHAGAQTTPTTQSTEDAEYIATITKRAQKHVDALKLDDAQKAARVQNLIVNQYRALRANHELRDEIKKLPAGESEKLKAMNVQSLQLLHDAFVSTLGAELTPDQVEKVKDEMTYDVVHVTYNAYCDELPQLTDPQKTYILAQLKEARELAMDQGSSKEKHGVFGKYKGRINNYLAKEGYDLKKAEKEWAERRKAREASAKQPTDKQD
jgi:hypothetical protein